MLYDLPDSQRILYRIPVGIGISIMLNFETENVIVGDSVGDGVLMQAFLEYVLGRNVLCLLAVDTGVATVLLEYRGPGKAKQLCLGEEIPDGCMILTELAAVTFIEDEDDPLVFEALQALVEAIPV